jgi:hypothetical protein
VFSLRNPLAAFGYLKPASEFVERQVLRLLPLYIWRSAELWKRRVRAVHCHFGGCSFARGGWPCILSVRLAVCPPWGRWDFGGAIDNSGVARMDIILLHGLAHAETDFHVQQKVLEK